MDRITRAYKNAVRLPLSDDDKLVLISDCHRGGGSLADNFLNNRNIYFAALFDYLRNGYTYIELGDGDELWEEKSFSDIAAAHGDVFWLLKQFSSEGRFYMLYGNHDIEKRRKKTLCYYDEQHCRSLMIGVQAAESICLDYGGNEILLLHGHQADFFNDRLWRAARFLVRYLWKPLELIGVSNPASAAYNPKKQNKVESRLSRWADENDKLIIAGHTHHAAFSRPGEGRYFNDGCCVHPSGITALEIAHGSIRQVKWRVKTRADGTLYAGRVEMQPPLALKAYFKTI